MAETVTGVVVDDEPLARAHLGKLLNEQGVQVIGEGQDAADALSLADDLHPDLLFLDVQMPGMSGMQAAAALMRLDVAPLLIFVTGYSEYAVDAFDNGALDYIVKPVAADRLARALARARSRLTASRKLARRTIDSAVKSGPRVRRLPVREDYTTRLIRVEEVVFARACDKRVLIHTAAAELRTYYTLRQLEALLPGETFLRIHDFCIANIDMIDEVISLGSHSYCVRMSSGAQLPVSRSRCVELHRRLGLTTL